MNYNPIKLKQSSSSGMDLTEQELKRLVNILDSAPGVRVGDLRYNDLMWPSLSCHGIYAFCEGDNYKIRYEQEKVNEPLPKYLYIGKTFGVPMIGRIAGHFAPRCKDYSNSLLRHIAYCMAPRNERGWIWEAHAPESYERHRADELIEKAFPVIQDLLLKVIVFEEVNDEDMRQCINETERALIVKLRPAFNYPKRFGNRQFKIVDINNQQVVIK